MVVSRVLSRVPRTLLVQCRSAVFICPRPHQHSSILSNHFHSLRQSSDTLVGSQLSLLHHLALKNFAFQRCGISSSASPQPSEKETVQSGNEQGSNAERNGKHSKTSEDAKIPDPTKDSGSDDVEASDQAKESGSNLKSQSTKRRRPSTKRTAFSDSDSEDELSMDDLVKLVAEKEELLKMKHKEIEKMQDKVLRSYAEMENVMDRTRREAENSKKFAVQSFAKSLLDVADNLQRASSVVKESFSKIDASNDTAGAVPLLRTLLEGVEMTDKQLAEVFRKFGVEKFDPTNEQFDPHRHNAVFQIPDGSKPPGVVASVLKSGYMLYDRVIRPAEVGVTREVDSEEAN
ncbi:grpE protein homolog 2, mitochondrial-like isoform X1 [Malania oleifera]|uniref:grpE protein homolog 2, mitochondrial-like isoform X1 n=1 Tax=Malania oleifera TaxID=397392 RepID=UPI0025ADFA19|nr:grpE protein homolog 2, mitochondrial-like isoform X1 [Malania oleifera]